MGMCLCRERVIVYGGSVWIMSGGRDGCFLFLCVCVCVETGVCLKGETCVYVCVCLERPWVLSACVCVYEELYVLMFRMN